jgi:hypothetical protein
MIKFGMIKSGAAASVFFTLACASGASAGGADQPLKDADIAAFISIWPQTAKALAAADPEFDPALVNGLRGQLEEMAASDSKDSKLDAVAAAAGYPDFETFAAQASRILLAAQWAKDAPDKADLNAAIDGVAKDQVRTAAEKADLAAALKQAYAKALAEKPADEDIAAATPFVGAVDKALAVDACAPSC